MDDVSLIEQTQSDQQIIITRNNQTHYIVSSQQGFTYPANTIITPESPFPTPSPSPSIILASPASIANIKSPINIKSPAANFQNVKSPNLYNVKSPAVKSPAHSRSPAPGCNVKSPGTSASNPPSPFAQFVSSPSTNPAKSPAPLSVVSPIHRPTTPQPSLTQYPPIAPNANLVQILQQQPGQLLSRAQLISAASQGVQKVKQPQQILPKPLGSAASPSPQKQSLPTRISTNMTQQPPLLINQPSQSPTLLINPVLTPGGPLLVQQTGTGSGMQLILRPPTPTLQSGPGPPQNKMIFSNTTQAQQPAVLIQQNRQIMRIMTTQGPMQLQQIQTPSGTQFIAIPQNQQLSFSNSVLVQNPATNTIQLQQSATNTTQLQQLQLQNTNNTTQLQQLQLQQNATNTTQLQQQLQLQQNANNTTQLQQLQLQQNATNTTQLQQQLQLQQNANNTAQLQQQLQLQHNANAATQLQQLQLQQNTIRIQQTPMQIQQSQIQLQTTANINQNGIILQQKLEEQDDKESKIKKIIRRASETEMSPPPPPTKPISMTNSNTINTISTVKTTQSNTPVGNKSVTSSLRQIRPGAFANRAKSQTMNTTATMPTPSGNKINNVAKVIDSVATNCEIKTDKNDKIDNLTATINSVAENIKASASEISDVLSLIKRPNLTIVQKQDKLCESEVHPNITINKYIVSDNETLLAQTGVFHETIILDDTDEKKKKTGSSKNSKKGKKEENKLDLWDLMKSAGIGDEEFDDQPEVTDSYTTQGIPESVEIPAESELYAQLNGSSQTIQLPGGLRLAVGEDGRPIIIDPNHIILQENLTETTQQQQHHQQQQQQQQTSQQTFTEDTHTPDITNILMNQDSLQGMTQQALNTAQVQLSQLLQEHNTVTPTDQQILNQLFGSGANGLGNANQPQIANSTNTNNIDKMVHNMTQVEIQHSADSSQNMVKMDSRQQQQMTQAILPDLPPLGADSLVITNNNGVPTLVASPALMQYLQAHQAIIQFQHDPVTKTIQPSLIIPHQPIDSFKQQQQQQQQQQQESQQHDKSMVQPLQVQSNVNKANVINKLVTTLENKKQATNTPVITSATTTTTDNSQANNMVKFIQNSPALLRIAKETNHLITLRDQAKNITENEKADLDRKIQQNRNILDQCFMMEAQKSGSIIVKDGNTFIITENTSKSSAETQTLQDLQNLDTTLMKTSHGPPSQNSPTPNSDFQKKYLESIGMSKSPASLSKTSVGTITTPSPTPTPTPTPPTPMTPNFVPNKRGRKKKNERLHSTEVQTDKDIRLSLNIAQLSAEQNLRLNQALINRGVTSQQIATLETNDEVKQIIHEEIIKITSGNIHGTNIKFVSAEEPPNPMIVSNPSLNQLLDQPLNDAMVNGNHNQILTIGSNQNQLVSLGNPVNSSNQVVTFGNSTPVNGSVIVNSSGNVVAIVHPPPTTNNGRIQTIQLTSAKQMQLKQIQAQIQNLNNKANRTQAEQNMLQKLGMEQQKILAGGKIIPSVQTSSAPAIQQQNTQQQNRIYTQPNTATNQKNVSTCGTNTSELNTSAGKIIIPTSQQNIPKLSVPPTVMISDNTNNYGPLYVSPNTCGKHVTKCEKGTSPIQVQMGTQTVNNVEFRGGKMSTGTMTSPSTGKPQAVVAPAIVIQQPVDNSNIPTTVTQMKGRCNQALSPSRNVAPTLSRTALIEQQMRTDQSGATMPDTHSPFTSKSDAVKRLIRYHCMEDKSFNPSDLANADDVFETNAQHLLDKFRWMKEKYKYLLMLESMREVSTAERIMVDRNFIIEERLDLENVREDEKRIQEEFENPTIKPECDLTNDIKIEPDRDNHMLSDPSQNNMPSIVKIEKTDQVKSKSIKKPRTSELDSDNSGEGDINAQVQSAIDSILNLQKQEDEEEELVSGARGVGAHDNKTDEDKCSKNKLIFKLDKKSEKFRRDKKRKHKDGNDSFSKKFKNEFDDDLSSDDDDVLDEAVRSITLS